MSEMEDFLKEGVKILQKQFGLGPLRKFESSVDAARLRIMANITEKRATLIESFTNDTPNIDAIADLRDEIDLLKRRSDQFEQIRVEVLAAMDKK
jgi:hypothetical protein